jgi:predicted O-methyltransferase YrrM
MIFGVMMVRNEADIIGTNLAHHLASGIDQVLVVDNGSTDGTMDILDAFAATGRVHVESRPGPFLQAATATELAREAFLRGAEWVLPTDADEFWHVPGGRLDEVLTEATGVGALEAEVVNFVQHRLEHDLTPGVLLTMTRRVAEPVGTSGEADILVEANRIGFVEIRYPPKCVSRGSIALKVAQGNHSVTGTGGPTRPTAALLCLHAPLRSRASLARQKVEPGRPLDEIEDYLRQTWQLRRWRRLATDGLLEAEWAANSYLDDCLDVYGEKHPLVIDTTLRDLVAPWIDWAASGVAEGSRRRSPTPAPRPAVVDLDAAMAAAILDRMERTEGWLRRAEADLLLQTTRRAVIEHAAAAAVVEIGSFCGKSTIVLAAAARSVDPGVRVYAIDPHQGEVGAGDTLAGVHREPPTFDRFAQNLADAGVTDTVTAIRQHSYEVDWQRPIAFLFVDGLHDYASVARDFHHFERHLAPGGYVAFHDCDDEYPGVQAFVSGFTGSDSYEEVDRAASLVVFRKVANPRSDDDAADRIAALTRRLEQQEKGISFLMAEIAAREGTIREREEGIEWLRSVVRDKEIAVAELERGVEWLRKEVRDRDRTIAALLEGKGADDEVS